MNLTVVLDSEIPAGDHVVPLLRVLDVRCDDAQRALGTPAPG